MTILGTHLEALVVKWYCKQYNVTLRREQGLFRLKCVAVGCTDPDCLCSQFACTADANGDFTKPTDIQRLRCAAGDHNTLEVKALFGHLIADHPGQRS